MFATFLVISYLDTTVALVAKFLDCLTSIVLRFNCSQVIRVDAPRHVADVINLHPFRDRPLEHFVCSTVRAFGYALAVFKESYTSVFIFAACDA